MLRPVDRDLQGSPFPPLGQLRCLGWFSLRGPLYQPTSLKTQALIKATRIQRQEQAEEVAQVPPPPRGFWEHIPSSGGRRTQGSPRPGHLPRFLPTLATSWEMRAHLCSKHSSTPRSISRESWRLNCPSGGGPQVF